MSVEPSILLSLSVLFAPFEEFSTTTFHAEPVAKCLSATNSRRCIPLTAVLNREYGVIFGYLIRAFPLFILRVIHFFYF
jgi:hypothetical protein